MTDGAAGRRQRWPRRTHRRSKKSRRGRRTDSCSSPFVAAGIVDDMACDLERYNRARESCPWTDTASRSSRPSASVAGGASSETSWPRASPAAGVPGRCASKGECGCVTRRRAAGSQSPRASGGRTGTPLLRGAPAQGGKVQAGGHALSQALRGPGALPGSSSDWALTADRCINPERSEALRPPPDRSD